MTEYGIPEQPDVSVVWDALGQEWTYVKHPHTGGWVWANSHTGEALGWNGLLGIFGPVKDYPPEPAHGTLWVTKNGAVWERRQDEYGAGWHLATCKERCTAGEKWESVYRRLGPLTPYVEPEPEPVPDPDPWETMKPGRLYWVTGHSKFWGGKVRGLGAKYGEHECLQGDGWLLMRSGEGDRLQSAVELTAVPTHLLDALIETAVDYDDLEDGNSVSREALHDLTDWLADHPQNTGGGHA